MLSKFIFVRGWKRISCITLSFVLFAMLMGVEAGSQQEPQPRYPGQSQAQHQEDVWEAQQRKTMAKKANLERQADIRKDTEKLLELATELKQEVDKSNENTLSLQVVRKAEEIEKLAKSVKNKMKGD